MNKNIYFVTAMTLASISFVGAQEVREVSVDVQRPMYQVRQGGGEVGQVRAVAARVMMATASPAMMPAGQMMGPTTGDPATDAKVKALMVEMDAKMRALQEEYATRLKAIIGDRVINTKDVRGPSPTGMMMGERVGQDGTMSTGTVRAMEQRRGIGRPMDLPRGQNGEGRPQGEGFGSQMSNLFRSIFGGNK